MDAFAGGDDRGAPGVVAIGMGWMASLPGQSHGAGR